MASWFKEEIFLIPNWAWFVIIVGIFCILMAIVIVTCVKKGDAQDENPEPVLMDGEEASDGGEKKEEVAAVEKADEPKEDEPKAEAVKQEEVVYSEPEPVLVEEPVQPIKEEKPAKKSQPKKTVSEKSENNEEKADRTAEKKSAKPKSAAAKPAPARSEKTAEKKPAAKSTASKPAPAKSEKTAEKKTAAKPAATKTAAKTAKSDDDKVYHISKRKEENKWQVKAEGAAKALKLFFTQQEAIDYAKSVAGNQEGRIVIHKEDGSFRKLSY